MNTGIDLRSIAVDLNSAPTVEPPAPIRVQTTDFSAYLRKFAGINIPSIPCAVICIAFDLIFTLITLVIGGTNTRACPIEPRLPIYLIVSSTINLVSIFLTIAACVIHIKGRNENMAGFFYVTLSAVLILIFQLFNFIWLIAGSVWIFSVLNHVQYTEMNKSDYCQGSVYRYTVVSIVLQYIIPFIICCCKNVPFMK